MQYILNEKEYNELIDKHNKQLQKETETIVHMTKQKIDEMLQTVEYRFIDYFNKEGIRNKNKDIAVIIDSIRQQYLGYDYRKYYL
jgi:hypothetical protein